MKLVRTLAALLRMLFQIKVFDPDKIYRNKRVAVIGAADSAFVEENGSFIDSFDIIVRVNKALSTWNPENEKFIGKRTDVLFHSFFENDFSGGGPLSNELLEHHGVSYLVHPQNDPKGLSAHLNFYKRHFGSSIPTWILRRKDYSRIIEELGGWTPTVGFCALETVLRSNCKEIFITGFTFFKTPYVEGYRDELLDKEENDRHIQKQGLHSPDKEFEVFSNLLKRANDTPIKCDIALSNLLKIQKL